MTAAVLADPEGEEDSRDFRTEVGIWEGEHARVDEYEGDCS